MSKSCGQTTYCVKGKKRLVILISGGGSNMQAVFDAVSAGELDAEPVCVVSSNHKAGGLERAKNFGVKTYVCPLSEFESKEARDRHIVQIAKENKADYILLLGYLGICTGVLVGEFRGRIINIHPALLPKYGGAGFYGLNVHKAVLAANEKESGATVHFVDEGTDTGEIIMSRSVPVLEGDTPEILQARVLEVEHVLIVDALKRVFEER